jgi:putative cell wall-binding protein
VDKLRLLACGILLAAVFAAVSIMPTFAAVGGFDGQRATTERLDESDPMVAAVRISQMRFDEGQARWAVVANGERYADALAGAALTGEGALLLTAADGRLPTDARAELERAVSPDGTVYLLGGTAAVAEPPLAGGRVIKRLSGSTRIETALAVADEVRRLYHNGPVILVRAFGPSGGDPTAAWADAVSAGAWAAPHVPVLLTESERLSPSVADWLSRNAVSRTLLIGGLSGLSSTVEESVPAPQRIAGSSRYATAVAVAERLWGIYESTQLRRFTVINGQHPDGWAFGLLASGLATDHDAPLLLLPAPPADVPEGVLRLASSCDTAAVDLLVMGSSDIVSPAQVAQLDAVDGQPCTETSPAPAPTPTPTRAATPSASPSPTADEEHDDDGDVYYANCDAARADGAAPIYRGEPGYRSGLDRDDDGIACE